MTTTFTSLQADPSHPTDEDFSVKVEDLPPVPARARPDSKATDSPPIDSPAADSGLFSHAGEVPLAMGHDEDDVGWSVSHQAVSDMLDSGHGFSVLTVVKDPNAEVEPLQCLFCAGPVFGDQWVCECRDTWDGCKCNACLTRQQAEAGVFRGVGRPPSVCSSRDCKRLLRNKQQRERRARERVRISA